MSGSNDARRREIDELFGAALSIDSADRSAFLEQRCADADLRKQVERLLEIVDQSALLHTGGGLDLALRARELGDRSGQPDDTHEGQTIRGYRLIEEIGAGGMGEVWKAEQTEPVRRLVALKLIKRGMDSNEVVARFESERQALAIMNHPNIAAVFDGGVSESGRPFFVMELVRGTPITEYCDQNRLSTAERLALFIQVCAGVQHAHHKGIIHRDIKPSNVLVTTETGPPVPKIIDFGVARATDQRLSDKALHTKLGSIVGTPGYMSPEQFEMGTIDVDTRADVYSLGVLLYEMLTSLPPFDWDDLDEAGFDELRRRIREYEPTRPSTRVEKEKDSSARIARQHRAQSATLVAELRGDLDWIVLKALEKDRTARYDSPHEFAQDIERHLRDEPVAAGPPSARYRLEKFARRNRMPLALAASILFGILGAGVALTYALVESNRQKAKAEIALAAAEQAKTESDEISDFLAELMRSAGPRHAGRNVTVREIIDEGAKTIDERFADDSLVGARLRQTMGVVYDGLGFYEEARPLLEKSVRIAEAELGEDDHETVAYRKFLADFYSHTGELTKARALYDRTLGIQEREFGPRSDEVGATLVNLSAMLSAGGEHAEAAAAVERSLKIYEDNHGPDNPHVIPLLNNLAVTLNAAGEYTRAREHCERALRAVESNMPGHPWVQVIRGNIADLFMAEGKNDTALVLHLEVLASREQALGEDHPDVAASLTSLAELYRLAGDDEAALDAANRALAIRERKLGRDARALAPALRVRAAVYEGRRELDLARADLERALTIDERHESSEHAGLQEDVEALVRVLRSMGEDAEADGLAARHPSDG